MDRIIINSLPSHQYSLIRDMPDREGAQALMRWLATVPLTPKFIREETLRNT